MNIVKYSDYINKRISYANQLIGQCFVDPTISFPNQIVSSKILKTFNDKISEISSELSLWLKNVKYSDALYNSEKNSIRLINNKVNEAILEACNNIRANMIDKSVDEIIRHLHQSIYDSSYLKYYDGHYADSVESALKEINERLKALYKDKHNKELDGETLFSACFNRNDTTLLKVADLSTESGKNKQEGFRLILVGAWQSLRSPKAHANVTITKDEAYNSLIIASMIMKEIDKAIEIS